MDSSVLTISCDECTLQGTHACDDCVVSFLLDHEPEDALVIDELRGKLNNGEAKLSGSVEMKALRPKKIDVVAHLSDVGDLS